MELNINSNCYLCGRELRISTEKDNTGEYHIKCDCGDFHIGCERKYLAEFLRMFHISFFNWRFWLLKGHGFFLKQF